MSGSKQSRRRTGAKKLEPIDWHEFANDAVLNGNMSTLYHRPPTEDPSAYASPEALDEIRKRVGRPVQSAVVVDLESSGAGTSIKPTVGTEPTVGIKSVSAALDVIDTTDIPTVGPEPTVGPLQRIRQRTTRSATPTAGSIPTVGVDCAVSLDQDQEDTPPLTLVPPITKEVRRRRVKPTVGRGPTVGIKQITDVQDALTLAGQVLYKAMYGPPDGSRSKGCTKGYRQLAAETHLDKDTVRDLISEFKDKGIVRQTGTYNPDTREAKTYEILSYRAILQIWRDAGICFVTTGRKRPMFCTANGESVIFIPTVGLEPTVAPAEGVVSSRPTVGMEPTVGITSTAAAGSSSIAGLIAALQQITGAPIDQAAAERLVNDCRIEAPDCTVEEIVEFAWSKAFLCRSGKIDNPVGFLITQIPKHFQGEALRSYRDKKRKEMKTAAGRALQEDTNRREADLEMAEVEARQRVRNAVAERHRIEQGIDLQALERDPEADEVLKAWATRMLRLGHRHVPRYD